MRTFRFRLSPLQKIKQHNIEQEELVLASLRREEEELHAALELGRQQLQRRMKEFVGETKRLHMAAKERDFDVYRTYMMQMEQQRLADIARNGSEQDACRERLTKLYQESKILERLEDRARNIHRKAEQREENIMLDELGGQTHERRHRQAGAATNKGVFLIAFIGTLCLIAVHEKWNLPFLLMQKAGFMDAPQTSMTYGKTPGAFESEQQIEKKIEAEKLTVAEMLNEGKGGEILMEIAERNLAIKDKSEELNQLESEIVTREERLKIQMAEFERLLAEHETLMARKDESDEETAAKREAARENRVDAAVDVLKNMRTTRGRYAAMTLLALWEMDGPKREIAMELFTRLPDMQRGKILDEIGKRAPEIGAELSRSWIEQADKDDEEKGDSEVAVAETPQNQGDTEGVYVPER